MNATFYCIACAAGASFILPAGLVDALIVMIVGPFIVPYFRSCWE